MDGGAHVVDEVKRLRKDYAVETFRGYMIRICQVGYDRGLRAPFRDMQHIDFINAFAAVLARVGVVAHFQDSAPNIVRVAGEETLDVVAVNGRASVIPEYAAERREPPQIAEPDCTLLRRQVAPCASGL